MTKQEALEKVRAARSAHIQWLARAEALINGVPLDKDQVPVTYTDCKFGQWYYGLGQSLADLDSFRAIEEPHRNLHVTYMKIFKELYGEDERTTLARWFGSKKKYKAARVVAARALLPEMRDRSNNMLVLLERLQIDIKKLPEDVLPHD
jgi:hypothetical protein